MNKKDRGIINAVFRRILKVTPVDMDQYILRKCPWKRYITEQYCKLTGTPIPTKKSVNAFFISEYRREGSPIFKGIKLPVKKRRKRIKRKEHIKKYNAYLNSTKWKEFKRKLFEERGEKCERCNAINQPIHGHHKTYVRLFNEAPEDIELLCARCHKKEHVR